MKESLQDVPSIIQRKVNDKDYFRIIIQKAIRIIIRNVIRAIIE
jgi:hypothetical protein